MIIIKSFLERDEFLIKEKTFRNENNLGIGIKLNMLNMENNFDK